MNAGKDIHEMMKSASSLHGLHISIVAFVRQPAGSACNRFSWSCPEQNNDYNAGLLIPVAVIPFPFSTTHTHTHTHRGSRMHSNIDDLLPHDVHLTDKLQLTWPSSFHAERCMVGRVPVTLQRWVQAEHLCVSCLVKCLAGSQWLRISGPHAAVKLSNTQVVICLCSWRPPHWKQGQPRPGMVPGYQVFEAKPGLRSRSIGA